MDGMPAVAVGRAMLQPAARPKRRATAILMGARLTNGPAKQAGEQLPFWRRVCRGLQPGRIA